jgi:hypothetical protein
MSFEHAIAIPGRPKGPDPEAIPTSDGMSFGFGS